ncbi:MAG: hypothetical protein KJ698_09795 [Actinobacteria bacterium]|nr:hypothetical protein [Actinomycetota bacterium]MBU1493532.1 hypothetical protein [Actinomycetota bacterium]MBU1865550.1 hypothetical protein [Actinomycetota bacterium]
MSRMVRTVIEMLALAVGLVGGYLYLGELGRGWLFWLLALGVVVVVIGWHGRRRLKRWARRLGR